MLYPKPNTQYLILSIIIKEPDSAKSLTEYCPIVGQNSVALLAELGSLMGMFVIGYWVLGNFTFIRSGTFNSHICDWEMGETSMLTFK